MALVLVELEINDTLILLFSTLTVYINKENIKHNIIDPKDLNNLLFKIFTST